MPEPATVAIPERWEVGSEFHWSDDVLRAPGTVAPSGPVGAVGFASGAGGLATLLASTRTPVVHLPSFFCIDVAAVLVQGAGGAGGVEVRWYRELPDGRGPRLDTLDARPGDAVLAVNLFGRGRPEPWRAWARRRPDVLLVEDHTHDPGSAWALGSTAPYCVASLRKTLPVPDGALVWSPRGLPLPDVAAEDNPGAATKLEAMHLKAAWLRGDGVRKQDFRDLQILGEDEITGCAATPSPFTRDVLPRLDTARLRARRATNVTTLLAALGADERSGRSWTVPAPFVPGAVPFGAQLLCATRGIRDALRRGLAEHHVYTAVHWPQSRLGLWSGDDKALDLGDRLLTVPIDHRYGADDVARVAAVVRDIALPVPPVPQEEAVPC